MSKRNKKQQQQSNRCSMNTFEVRPVTKSDKWCQIKIPRNGELIGDAPFGYIVTIPYLPNQKTFLENVDGYIVRTKKHCGMLLLQVIMKKGWTPAYGINSFTRHEPNASCNKRKNKKKLYRILNIRNLGKISDEDTRNEWYTL